MELELVLQFPERHAVHTLQRILERAVLPQVAIEHLHPPVAELLREPVVDRAAQRVYHAAEYVLQLLEPGHPTRNGELPHHHLVQRVLPFGPVLGQALRPPQRYEHAPRTGMPDVGVVDDRQLEGVHQLVSDRVPELCVVAVERHRHPLLQELGDSEDTLGRDEREDVRLLEVGVRRVDDERDATGRREAELLLEVEEALLRVVESNAGELLLGRIEVEIDVRSAQHLPIESAVLHLVLAEVL